MEKIYMYICIYMYIYIHTRTLRSLALSGCLVCHGSTQASSLSLCLGACATILQASSNLLCKARIC